MSTPDVSITSGRRSPAERFETNKAVNPERSLTALQIMIDEAA
ncbi:hypothetical protein [Agrobacterium sp. NPDC090273]|nr:hypothetical protein [Agrobacterium tumefaciens]